MISTGYSFKLISGRKNRKESFKTEKKSSSLETPAQKDKTEGEIDSKKRSFMKVAGVVGVGALAATLVPKKAQALVFGSTPTSNVVGLRDSNNNKINPAKEDGNLATVATNTTPLVTPAAGGYIQQDSNASIAKETGGNLATVATNTATIATNTATAGTNTTTIATNTTNLTKLTFDGSNNLLTSTKFGAGATVGLNDTTNTQVNPATEDSSIYLRRMVKLLESQAVVDSATRQRITLDAITAGLTLATVTTVSTLTTITNAVPVGNVATIAGQGEQMYQDVARNAFANGIRQNLVFVN